MYIPTTDPSTFKSLFPFNFSTFPLKSSFSFNISLSSLTFDLEMLSSYANRCIHFGKLSAEFISFLSLSANQFHSKLFTFTPPKLHFYATHKKKLKLCWHHLEGCEMNSFCGQLTVLAKSMQPNVCYVCLLYICVCVVRNIYMAYK